MGLTKQALSISAAMGIATAALAVAAPTSVFAGTGFSQYCFDNSASAGGDDIPILTGQGGLWLGVELGALTDQSASGLGHAALCFSQTPPGSAGPEVSGVNVSIDVANSWGHPDLVDAECRPDPEAVVQPGCHAVANPTVTFQPAAAPAQGGTYTVSVPFTVCFGTSLTGGCSPSLSGPVGMGSTGVIVTSVTTGAPSGTDTGAGASVPSATLWLAGIPFGLDGPADVAAGVGTQSVTAHPNNSTPLCVLNGYCPSVPTGAGVAFTGTQDVYSISVNGTTWSYNPGYYCIVDSPGTAPC